MTDPPTTYTPTDLRRTLDRYIDSGRDLEVGAYYRDADGARPADLLPYLDDGTGTFCPLGLALMDLRRAHVEHLGTDPNEAAVWRLAPKWLRALRLRLAAASDYGGRSSIEKATNSDRHLAVRRVLGTAIDLLGALPVASPAQRRAREEMIRIHPPPTPPAPPATPYGDWIAKTGDNAPVAEPENPTPEEPETDWYDSAPPA